MADRTRAEITFPTHDEPFTVTLSPVPMGAYLAFRRDFNTPGGLDEFEATMRSFEALAQVSCGCGEPFAAHDLTTARALVSFWVERMWEVAPPLPVESSARTASPEDSSQTAAPSSRRRSSSTPA